VSTVSSSQPSPAHSANPAADFGTNEWLVEEMYQQYLADPHSVDQAWHDFFADYRPGGDAAESAPVAPPAVVPAPATPAVRRPATPVRPVPRLAPGGRLLLTAADPAVTLTRVQSGIGTLTVEAVVSPAVGDVRLGAAWQLTDGSSGVVQPATGVLAAPAGSRRPVLRAAGDRHERLVLDLRQSRSLARLLVYAYSGSGAELDWGGTLVLTTAGGARAELPMELGRSAGPVALLSLYAIDGEFVLRAERDVVGGAARDVARAYGYDRISWADGWTPVG